MVRNRRTNRIEPIESLVELHRFIPEVQRDVSLDFHSIADLGSSEVTPKHWVTIARKIQSLYHRCDGFVVIHGTNTMSFTGAALSFALQNLSKPVVLTGSLLPIDDIGSDARMNLTYAIEAALLDLAEVCIAVGPRVLRATRAKKVDQSMFETFESPKCRPLAEFNVSTQLAAHRVVRRKRSLVARPSFDTSIVCMTLHPGMLIASFDAILRTNPHGIVLRAYGQGMVPEEFFPWMRAVTDREIPIVITSQLLRGSIDFSRFRKQLFLEDIGVVSAGDMTHDCAVVKLMWVLAQERSLRGVKELMEKNLVNEKTDDA